jgi:hypothetical protein
MPVLSVVCLNCGTRAGQLGRQAGPAENVTAGEFSRRFLLGLCGGVSLTLAAVLVYARLLW